MNEADDDYTLIPTELDSIRLEQLNQSGKDGRVEAENHTWVAIFFEAKGPLKKADPRWCDWSLLVNCPGISARCGTAEFKNMQAMVTYLGALEEQRKRAEDDAK